jgi:hypothetical protein
MTLMLYIALMIHSPTGERGGGGDGGGGGGGLGGGLRKGFHASGMTANMPGERLGNSIAWARQTTCERLGPKHVIPNLDDF